MKTLDEIKNIIASHMDILKSRYKVKEIGVFGSYVRGKPGKKSIFLHSFGNLNSQPI